LIVPVLLSGLFLTGCVSDPYADDGDYRSSQGEYYGDHHDYDDTYIDEPRARVEVYASSGPYGYRTRYRNPYYARHYSGYYFDPFYGVYYSYGRGSYGPYGSYRSGYGYYCPVHSSYFGHSHYRSHSHRRHHHNVRRYNHNRDYRRHNVRNRNNVIQPNTEGLATTRRGAGNRNSGTSNPRNNRDGSLGQRGLDGQTVTRDNSIDPRDRFIRNNEIRTNTTNNRRRARRVVAPTPDTSANTQGSNRQVLRIISNNNRDLDALKHVLTAVILVRTPILVEAHQNVIVQEAIIAQDVHLIQIVLVILELNDASS